MLNTTQGYLVTLMRPAKPRGRSVQSPLFNKQKELPPAPRPPPSNPPSPTVIANLFIARTDCYLQHGLRHPGSYSGAVSSFVCTWKTPLPRLAGTAAFPQHMVPGAGGSSLRSRLGVVQVMLEQLRRGTWLKAGFCFPALHRLAHPSI